MNDEQLRRWAEQQEKAREVRGGMVLAAYMVVFFLLGLVIMMLGLIAALPQVTP